MWEILFLLLPIAAVSGFYFGKKPAVNPKAMPDKYFVGLNYLLNEQPDKAMDVFSKMLDLDDDLIETQFTLANIFRKKGEVDRAIRIHEGLLTKPILSKQHRSLSLLELARDYISAGMLDRAEKLLTELTGSKQHVEISFRYLLRVYQQSKDWLRAIQSAEKLQKISNKDLSSNISHYYCELSQEAWIENDITKAKKFLKQAEKSNPNSIRTKILAGDIEKGLGNYAIAIKHYHRVIEQDPNFYSEVAKCLSSCYEKLHDSNGLVEYLRQCLQAKPSLRMIEDYATKLGSISGNHQSLKFLIDYLRENPSIRGLSKLLQLNISTVSGSLKQDLHVLHDLIEKSIAVNPSYKCENCGFSSRILQWSCPGCKLWDTIYPI